jgi:D-beta-D-heptose 7-phosphate kinase/D-beta-D-heptose 1-phosphate adenosyltransferase
MIGPVVVVGDIVLDRDIEGTVQRLCPDVPVPVLDESSIVERPGGAGLAATFLARDGAEVVLIGALGSDAAGDRTRELLDGMGVDLLELGYEGPTPEKVRLRAGRHSLLRLDRGTTPGRLGTVPGTAAQAMRNAAAILVSDYGRGVTSLPALRRALSAVHPQVPVVWDPHPRGATPVPGVQLVCPNRTEAALFATAQGLSGDPEPAVAAAAHARLLRGVWHVGAVAVTVGEAGAVLADSDGTVAAVTPAGSYLGDSCGAGDRFAAAATIGLARGWPVRDAISYAVDAASAYVAADGPASLQSTLTREVTNS